MSITISEQAAKKIKLIQQEKNIPEDARIRVGVVSGGCSGLTYDLNFDDDPDKQGEKDQEFDVNGVRLVVDMRSFLYLSGTELDYSEGLEGQGFYFENPNATRTCSCGESFSV